MTTFTIKATTDDGEQLKTEITLSRPNLDSPLIDIVINHEPGEPASPVISVNALELFDAVNTLTEGD